MSEQQVNDIPVPESDFSANVPNEQEQQQEQAPAKPEPSPMSYQEAFPSLGATPAAPAARKAARPTARQSAWVILFCVLSFS